MNKQTKWLVGLVALLVIINIVLIASIWLKKEEGFKPPPADAREFLVKNLSLTGPQQKTFDSLRNGHFERMKEYRSEMRQLKDKLFAQLDWPRNAEADTLAKKIGNLQAVIDLETFEHFASLRSILNNEQTKKFDNIIQDVIRTMGPRGRPDGPPPGDSPGFPPPHDGPPQ